MLEDREEVKIVKKAEELQNKAGSEREEVVCKKTEAAAGKMQRALEKTHQEKEDLQQTKAMIDKRDKITDSLQHQLWFLGSTRIKWYISEQTQRRSWMRFKNNRPFF